MFTAIVIAFLGACIWTRIAAVRDARDELAERRRRRLAMLDMLIDYRPSLSAVRQ